MKLKPGFTFIELILYMAIASIILFSIVTFAFALLENRVKGESITDVDQQELIIMQLISQEIRNSESIILPLPGTTSSQLILNVVATSSDPTIFFLSASGTLQISEGGIATTTLTDTTILASDLIFTNLSATTTPGNIRTEFTLTHVNPAGRNEYDFSRRAISTASLRPCCGYIH